jgi:hypothetical protein
MREIERVGYRNRFLPMIRAERKGGPASVSGLMRLPGSNNPDYFEVLRSNPTWCRLRMLEVGRYDVPRNANAVTNACRRTDHDSLGAASKKRIWTTIALG